MFKKIMVASALLLTASVALADPVPYVAVGTGVIVNTANNGTAGGFRGMPFDAYFGYGGLLSPTLYMAGELGGTVATASYNSGSLKSTYTYGVSVLPGVMITDQTLGYFRLGVVRTKFSTINSIRTGGQLGVGMQTGLTPCVDLRGEYDFLIYRGFSSAGVTTSPRSDKFTVGLIYKF